MKHLNKCNSMYILSDCYQVTIMKQTPTEILNGVVLW